MCCRSSMLVALIALVQAAVFGGNEIASFYASEVDRFDGLLASESKPDRLEGIKGLSGLKRWQSEGRILAFCSDDSADVRLEAATALNRIGSKRAIPHLISLLEDESWEVAGQAHAALCAFTGERIPQQQASWEKWWKENQSINPTRVLFGKIERSSGTQREDLVRVFRHLAGPEDEKECLRLLQHSREFGFTPHEVQFLCEALERIGTTNAIPVLERLHNNAAAWALGAIGGSAAEVALLKFPKSSAVLLNLDRIESTNCGNLLPHLVHSFGLVTYRAHPDDLDLPTAQPAQRVAANLIVRIGRAPLLIEATLRELEATMYPPIRREPVLELPEDLSGLLKRMREELKPGFVRGDGETTSQPVAAVYHIASDPALAPRLIPLLRHPAFVPRIYVAMLLGKLKSAEAVSEMAQIICEGYGFSDATALASGKHFEQSQTVRWRGFLCMALGKVGSEPASRALEEFACDPKQPRDVRYGAVVGLGFALNPESESALEKVAREDVIWMIRGEAARVLDQLRLKKPKLAVRSK